MLEGEANPITRVKAAMDVRAFRRVLDLVESSIPRILDVGGGTGAVSRSLVRACDGNAHATVVDLDERSIEVARSHGLEGFVGRFEDFHPGDRFDVVLMLNLIEHVADPVSILRKAREMLAPAGVIWIQTPNFRALDARLFRRRSWAGLHCPRHWVVFSDRGLRKVLDDKGFRLVRFDYTQAGSFWAASVLGLRGGRFPAGPGETPKPLIQHPAYLPIAAAGAAFDLMTRRVRPTSQVVAFARPG